MKKFKTESKKLLDLMINSIYTNREIFLRGSSRTRPMRSTSFISRA